MEDRVEQLEQVLLEAYRLLGSWVKTGHTPRHGNSIERHDFQDWLKTVDAIFSDEDIHIHRDFGEDPCTKKHEGGYKAVWCAKPNGYAMPTMQMTHHPDQATCPECLEHLRVALCARADEAMTKSFAISVRQSALKSAENGEAPPIKKK